MAKIDVTDPAVFLNPAAYSGVKEEKKLKSQTTKKTQAPVFSNLFDNLLGKTAEALGPIHELPVSEDSVNLLMDNVRDTGDKLLNSPLPEQIIRYKQAVRNFINYIVKNAYELTKERGLPKQYKPGFKGQRGTPDAMYQLPYFKIDVIDKKLEDMASMLLSRQVQQLELISKLEEIKGLLIDLMQ
jgi:uncharacterized protein YaaR (DUF327 family)